MLAQRPANKDLKIVYFCKNVKNAEGSNEPEKADFWGEECNKPAWGIFKKNLSIEKENKH